MRQKFVRCCERIFGTGNFSECRFRRKNFFLNVETPADAICFIRTAGIIRVIDGEVVRIPETFTVPAQNPCAGGMKGRGPDLVSVVPEHPAQAFFELSGGLIGEGNGEDSPRLTGTVGETEPHALRERCALFQNRPGSQRDPVRQAAGKSSRNDRRFRFG